MNSVGTPRFVFGGRGPGVPWELNDVLEGIRFGRGGIGPGPGSSGAPFFEFDEEPVKFEVVRRMKGMEDLRPSLGETCSSGVMCMGSLDALP